MNNDDFPILKTERLILRQLENFDAEMVFYLRTDKIVTAFIKRKNLPNNVEDAQKFIAKTNLDIANNKLIYWCIRTLSTAKMIGAICLWNFSNDKKTAEIGYELSTKFQHKGIMSEAMKCILDYGFKQLQLEKIEAYTHKENIKSKSLLVKHHFYFDCPFKHHLL